MLRQSIGGVNRLNPDQRIQDRANTITTLLRDLVFRRACRQQGGECRKIYFIGLVPGGFTQVFGAHGFGRMVEVCFQDIRQPLNQ